MKALRKFSIILLCFVIIELALAAKTISSKRKATMMLQAVDTFRLGMTSKDQALSSFSQIGLETSDEACSSSKGSCDGIAVEIDNTPEFTGNMSGRIASYALEHVSLFRPASLIGNFYFVAGRLESMSVRLSTARADVGVELKAKEYDENTTTITKHNYHTGSDTIEQGRGPSQQREASLAAAQLLNLKCLESLVGCRSNSELWLGTASQTEIHP